MGMENFGDKLKDLRTGRKMTQDALAKRLGIVRATISAYESSALYPSVEVLIKLCQIFDVSADFLLDLTQDKNSVFADLTPKQLSLTLGMIEEFEAYNESKKPSDD